MLTKAQGDKIVFYKNQLELGGYAPFQISQIIKDTVGNADIRELPPSAYDELVAALEYHVKFADRCRVIKK